MKISRPKQVDGCMVVLLSLLSRFLEIVVGREFWYLDLLGLFLPSFFILHA